MDMMLPNRGAAARGGYAMPEGLDDADESAGLPRKRQRRNQPRARQ